MALQGRTNGKYASADSSNINVCGNFRCGLIGKMDENKPGLNEHSHVIYGSIVYYNKFSKN